MQCYSRLLTLWFESGSQAPARQISNAQRRTGPDDALPQRPPGQRHPSETPRQPESSASVWMMSGI
ncbi:hypothetical protein C2E23DRAFT_837949 [Lenzites betulinus]|nr:hypothetical protein C2E23DRAFT_837949 [Lenzites betulinus]